MPLMQWHIKSTTKAQQGLYEYDAVSRLRDSQLGDERVRDIHNYIVKGVLWQAFTAPEPVVLLIDEIDKADIEFPNDLLRELDRMEFYVYETREMVVAKHRPLVIITSNNEKELPDAFLRRCFFHYIKFPDKDTMEQIVKVHYPTLKQDLLAAALQSFYEVRDVPGLKKKPSTSEFLDWLKLLLAEDIPAEALRSKDAKAVVPPLHGALLKNEQDVHLFERLVVHVEDQPLMIQVDADHRWNSTACAWSRWRSRHADGLRAAASDGELWNIRVTSVPEPHNVEQYIDTALGDAGPACRSR